MILAPSPEAGDVEHGDVLDVDMAIAEPKGKRNLLADSTSVLRLMTHLPKNPHCPSCQRAKMQAPPHRVGAMHASVPKGKFG